MKLEILKNRDPGAHYPGSQLEEEKKKLSKLNQQTLTKGGENFLANQDFLALFFCPGSLWIG
jgi:hypothetical protein